MAWFKALLLALGHAKAQHLVDMHTIVGIECGQVQFEAGWADWVQELAGLQEGSCDSMGFSESAGFKEVDLPVVGKFSLGIFRKPDILGVAMQLGQQLSGQPATQGEACCQTCKKDEEKFVRVASGACQETCLTVGKKLIISLAGLLDPGFQRGVSSCVSQGFPVHNATLTKGLEPAGFSWDVYVPQPPHTQTLRKVAAGICGEVTLSDEQKELAPLQTMGLLEPGTCISEGFSQAMGKQQIPGLGDLALFQKAGELDIIDAVHMLFAALIQDTVVLYKVVGDVCSEASVDRKFVQPLVAMSFAEGSCKESGYDQPAGSQSFTVLLTDVQLALYHKASLGIQI